MKTLRIIFGFVGCCNPSLGVSSCSRRFLPLGLSNKRTRGKLIAECRR